jgi:hypothetical protein
MYCWFVTFSVFFCVYMCTVLLPPAGYSIAVKYIISKTAWTYTTISTSHVLPDPWPHIAQRLQSTICYYQDVKLSDQLPFAMLFSQQRHTSAVLHTRNSKDRTCEDSTFLLQRGKVCEWTDNWSGQAQGCLIGVPACLKVGVQHWAANRWLETIV